MKFNRMLISFFVMPAASNSLAAELCRLECAKANSNNTAECLTGRCAARRIDIWGSPSAWVRSGGFAGRREATSR
ncbi:hypothetical protein, partial [Roseateles sp.]|uniref:hypothetical protein n=1 Tax=Roseateles sp. TaxID=1971397 RepID=UPI00286B12F5